MDPRPGWLPAFDVDSAATAVREGLTRVVETPAGQVLTATATADPTMLVLGTVLGSLTKAELEESARKLDLRLEQYAADHDDPDVMSARVARGICRLLPDGRELNAGALQAARGDPEPLRRLLTAYFEDDDKRREVDEAVQRLLRGDFDELETELTDAFDTDDVEAAQALYLDFRDLIEARQTQETLAEVLELREGFERIEGVLTNARADVEDEFDRLLVRGLWDEGFRRLSPVNFADDPTDEEPAVAWRRGFDLVEVRAGFAIDRRRDPDAADGLPSDESNVTTALVSTLARGENRLVRGPPGAGKSTICKAVASRWYDRSDTGPVLYRASGRGLGFSAVGTLTDAIRDASGHVLVVVEDAVRPDARMIFEVIAEEDAADVSFLLDARRDEHAQFEPAAGRESDASDRQRYAFDTVPTYDVPALSETECGLVVERFESVTGRSVLHDPAYLHRQIRTDANIGSLLFLAYYLPITGEGDAAGDIGLRGDVGAKFRTVRDPDADSTVPQGAALAAYDPSLRRDVVLMMNLLNASGIGVHPQLVYALVYEYGTDRETLRAIGQIRSALDGWMFFERRGGSGRIARTTHELWSALYLRQEAETYVEERNAGLVPVNRFARCVNALFALVDDPDRRETIAGVLGSGILADIDADPQSTADQFLSDLFDLGKQWPVLAPLYDERVLAPADACSRAALERATLAHGAIYRKHEEYERARRRYELVLERVRGRSDDDRSKRQGARALTGIGLIALRRGDFATARKYLRRSLRISEDIDDHSGKALSLNNLGAVAQKQGDFETAREYYRRSLTVTEGTDDRNTKALSLNNLGIVAQKQDDFATARKYYRRSLRIKEAVGDRSGRAMTLDNLGVVAQQQDDFATARTFHRRSLRITEEIGDRSGAARSLNNLGIVDEQTGALASAADRFERAANVRMDIGAAGKALSALSNLYRVADEMGDAERALDACDTALELVRENAELSDEPLDWALARVRLRSRDPSDRVSEAHSLGCRLIATGRCEDGHEAERIAWQLREAVDPGTGSYISAMVAGVVVAAHLRSATQRGVVPDTTLDEGAILDEIRAAEPPLSRGAGALFERLYSGTTDTTPAALRAFADGEAGAKIERLEARACARLLDRLDDG